jgi:HEAT repeat protein
VHFYLGINVIKHHIIMTILVFLISISSVAEAITQDASIATEIDKQISKLQSGTPRQKINAARRLGEIGPDAATAVPYLIELIDSNEKNESLFDKLWNTISILGSSGIYVRNESQQALSKIGSPAVEPLANVLLKHSRPSVRWNAAMVLGNIKDAESVEPLVKALKTDSDDEVRMWSADALGKLSEKWSVDALGNAVQALIEALKDSDPNVRQKASYALGMMKATEAVPALIETLQTYGKDSGAGLTLFMITGQRLGDDPQKWREWREKNEKH